MRIKLPRHPTGSNTIITPVSSETPRDTGVSCLYTNSQLLRIFFNEKSFFLSLHTHTIPHRISSLRKHLSNVFPNLLVLLQRNDTFLDFYDAIEPNNFNFFTLIIRLIICLNIELSLMKIYFPMTGMFRPAKLYNKLILKSLVLVYNS